MQPCATLQTERLLLRPFALADAPAVQRLAGERAIADTTLNIPHPYEDGMAEGLLRQHTKKWELYEDLVEYAILREDWQRLAAPAAPRRPQPEGRS